MRVFRSMKISMNSIKKLLHTDSFKYVLFAFLISAIAFFAVLPFMSDVNSGAEGPSFAASLVAAFGGDAGGDGGVSS